MDINNLAIIMPPPSSPFEAVKVHDWTSVEEGLGISLPADYKEFIELYGTGSVDGFLWLFNPVSSNKNINLMEQINVQSKVLTELKLYGAVIPYEVFPINGGILPFGITDNGDVLFWETLGKPNDWTVVVNEGRSPEWQAFDMSMSKFLLEILARRLSCNLFPKSFPSSSPVFAASH